MTSKVNLSSYQRVLLATSDPDAIEAAKDVALNAHAQVKCLRTLPEIGDGIENLLPSLAEQKANLRSIAKEKLREAVLEQGIDAKDEDMLVEFGSKADTVLASAKKLEVDLIVVNGNNADRLGSSVHKIVDQAPCDVLISRTPTL